MNREAYRFCQFEEIPVSSTDVNFTGGLTPSSDDEFLMNLRPHARFDTDFPDGNDVEIEGDVEEWVLWLMMIDS
jgi:hypothetical protein